jgi:hypothetical protein
MLRHQYNTSKRTVFSLARALSPQAPPKIALLCSSGSSILRRGPTPPERACPPCGFGPSRTGLVPLRAEALQRSPGSRACCFSACAGSKTTLDRLLAREYREAAVVPSPNQERVGVLVLRFSKLNSPARRYPCLRFERHLTMPPARLRAKMESLSPFLLDSFIPYNMPVYPGAPRLTLPAQPVDATPSKQLIGQWFPIENRSVRFVFIRPIQGSVLV